MCIAPVVDDDELATGQRRRAHDQHVGTADLAMLPQHWMELARSGVRLAREAVAVEGRAGETAVAFPSTPTSTLTTGRSSCPC